MKKSKRSKKVRALRTKCPECGGGLAVKKTHNKAGSVIIRKRECRECGKNIYTHEIIRAVQGTLLKK